jgi:hypothetical protein
MLPSAPVSSYLTVSPITSEEAGLFSVALVVTRSSRVPGRYPARCPMVFGLSSCPERQATARSAPIKGKVIIAKNVEQINTGSSTLKCKALGKKVKPIFASLCPDLLVDLFDRRKVLKAAHKLLGLLGRNT